MVFSVSDFLSLSLSSWYCILWPKPLGGWKAGVGCMGCVLVQGLGRQDLGLPLATLLTASLEAIPPLAPFPFPKSRVSADSMGASCPLLATARVSRSFRKGSPRVKEMFLYHQLLDPTPRLRRCCSPRKEE